MSEKEREREREKVGEIYSCGLKFTRELSKLWIMRVTVIPIVIGAIGMVAKGLERGLEVLEIGGRIKTVQTTALRSARIPRRDLNSCEDLLSPRLQ